MVTAGPDDFDTEWLSLVLGLKVVDDLDEAIEHIGAHSTAHSDGILTETDVHAQRFVDEVDSAAVYVSMPALASLTAHNSASELKSLSARRSYTRAGRWDYQN